MRKIIGKAIGFAVVGVLALGAASCAATDVIGKVAGSSFKAVIDASAGKVSYSKDEGAWILASSAGDQLMVASDFARNNGDAKGGMKGMADMDKPDVEFSFDAAPFIAAGLDPAKLTGGEGFKYELEDGRLMLHFEIGAEAFGEGAKKSIEGTFAEIVRTHRNRIGYHEKLDHYNIKLGDGNMFEWAKDMAKNDKDIVWVLNPAPLVVAGVDPAKVTDWAFAKVEMKDDAGKTVLVDKLLKPFDLK
ncbi:MAG: hypothetical protein WCT14_17990 [Treponemataceae bacterium]